MKNPFASDLSGNLGLLLARIPLGLYFALLGYAHFRTQSFATQYVAALPSWMPSEARHGYSSMVPFIEMAVGGLLLLGLTTRVGGFLAAVMTGLLVAAAGFSLDPDGATKLLPLIVLGLSILMLCMGGGKFTLDNFLFNQKKQEAH